MDDGMLRTAEAAPPRSGIPLDLAPLLLPYRRHERLSLRIERLPNRARFSRGHANDDRTWSLTLDDLHDLDYLPPPGMDAPHTLALRIVSLDGDIGATLAVLDFPVVPGEAKPRPVVSTAQAAPGEGDVELRLLRDSLAAAKTALAAREAELAAVQQQAEQSGAERARHAVEAERAAARTAWESELQERLAAAAAEAAAALEQHRAAWQRTEQERAAQAEARAQERLAAAQEAWQHEAKAALTQAEQSWKAKVEEAARLAAATATAQKQERSAEALAEATARSERAEAALAEMRAQRERAEAATAEATARREQVETAFAELSAASDADRAELRRLRDALAALKASSVAREAELTGAQQQAEQSWAEQSRQAIEAELAAARTAWEGEFAAARAAWEDELQQHLAAAAAAAEAQLEEHRAAWQAALEDRAAPSEAPIEEHLAAARAAWEQETRAALAEAAEAWQAGEAERLAAAAAQGREEWAQALAEAGARLERAETALAEAREAAERDRAELRRLNDALAAAKATEPAAPTLFSRFSLSKVRPRLPLAPLGHDPADRLAVSPERVRSQSDRTDRGRDPAGGREGEGESATELGQYSRAAPLTPTLSPEGRGGSILLGPTDSSSEPQAEEPPAPAAPAARLDIGKLPQAQALLAERLQKEAQPEPVAEKPAAPPAPRRRGRAGRWVLAGALAAGLAGAAVFYAGGDTASPEGWPALAALTDWIDASVQKLDALILPSPPEAPPAAEQRTIVAIPTRLHASPSTRATVLAILPRDTEVTPVERRGKWVRIRTGADGARPQEGWVYATALKKMTGS